MLRNKVPAVTTGFWVVKLLTTGMGETLSDFLVKRLDPVPTVVAVGLLFVAVLIAQCTARRCIPWLYWLSVAIIAVFGTMVADAAHVVVGVPYALSTVVIAALLATVFVVWRRVEGTIDVHEIDTPRRERFYWTVVILTFALGTAAGDLIASTFGLGFLVGGLVFLGLLLVPVVGTVTRAFSTTVGFWFAYVLTRPIGASFADWGAVSPARGGLGLGAGLISAVVGMLVIVIVATMSVDDARVRRQDLAQLARTS